VNSRIFPVILMLWEDFDKQFQDFTIVEPEFHRLLDLSRKTLRSFPENLQMELINLQFFPNLNCWLSDTKLQDCYFYVPKQFSCATQMALVKYVCYVHQPICAQFSSFMNDNNKTDKTSNVRINITLTRLSPNHWSRGK
jgi:hypothetical protein